MLLTYRFFVEDDLREGRLVELLPKWSGASRPLSLLYSADRHKPLRVRVLIGYLVAKLSTR